MRDTSKNDNIGPWGLWCISEDKEWYAGEESEWPTAALAREYAAKHGLIDHIPRRTKAGVERYIQQIERNDLDLKAAIASHFPTD